MKQSKLLKKIPTTGTGKKKHLVSFRMDDKERIEFQRQLEQANVKDRTEFIKACIFGRPIKVVTFNIDIHDYWKTLSNLQAEYRFIGVNYNQIVKVTHTAFTEKKILLSLERVEKQTLKLMELNKLIIELTEELKDTWINKNW